MSNKSKYKRNDRMNRGQIVRTLTAAFRALRQEEKERLWAHVRAGLPWPSLGCAKGLLTGSRYRSPNMVAVGRWPAAYGPDLGFLPEHDRELINSIQRCWQRVGHIYGKALADADESHINAAVLATCNPEQTHAH